MDIQELTFDLLEPRTTKSNLKYLGVLPHITPLDVIKGFYFEGFGDIQSIVAICITENDLKEKGVFSYRKDSDTFTRIKDILEKNNIAENLLLHIEK